MTANTTPRLTFQKAPKRDSPAVKTLKSAQGRAKGELATVEVELRRMRRQMDDIMRPHHERLRVQDERVKTLQKRIKSYQDALNLLDPKDTE